MANQHLRSDQQRSIRHRESVHDATGLHHQHASRVEESSASRFPLRDRRERTTAFRASGGTSSEPAFEAVENRCGNSSDPRMEEQQRYAEKPVAVEESYEKFRKRNVHDDRGELESHEALHAEVSCDIDNPRILTNLFFIKNQPNDS